MKKKLVIAAAAVVALVGASVVIKVFHLDPVAPYAIRPGAVAPVASGTPEGFSFDPATHVLSVVSDAKVTVVADPGKSFKHEEIWLVTQQPGNERMQYQFTLAKNSNSANHIHPLGSSVPSEIHRATQVW